MTIDCQNESGRFRVFVIASSYVNLTDILTAILVDYEALSPYARAIVFRHRSLPSLPDIQLADTGRREWVRYRP
jgi:hypothetical protein